MALGSDTIVVNGQRFSVPTSASYAPRGYGQQITGVPQVSPTMPPFLGSTSGGGAGTLEGVGGYGTSGNNQLATALAAQNPHSLTLAPTWWAVGGLLLGLALLKGVSWRDTVEEKAGVGPIREEARASD